MAPKNTPPKGQSAAGARYAAQAAASKPAASAPASKPTSKPTSAPAPASKPAPKPSQAPKPQALKPSQIATFAPSKAAAVAAQRPMADQGAAYAETLGGGKPVETPVDDKKPEEKPPGNDETPYDDSTLRSRITDLENELNARRASERADAIAFLKDSLTQYGMGDLASAVEDLVTQWGNNTGVILNNLRQTSQYKERFKGLVALQSKGITDVPNEASYIDLERRYRQVFRDNGIQNFLGEAGSKAERDAIAKLVGDYSLSVNEVESRVVDAQRVVADTPAEVRESLQRYYNIDPATLTQYVLDPTRTSSRINQLANAAIVGGYATRTGLEFGAGAAERIGEFLGGGQDLRGSAIEPQLTEIASTQRATERLANIEKGTLSAEETALGQLGLDAAAAEKVRTLQSRERARFGGSSAITKGTLSRSQNI